MENQLNGWRMACQPEVLYLKADDFAQNGFARLLPAPFSASGTASATRSLIKDRKTLHISIKKHFFSLYKSPGISDNNFD
jgi:hypothetical protein